MNTRFYIQHKKTGLYLTSLRNKAIYKRKYSKRVNGYSNNPKPLSREYIRCYIHRFKDWHMHNLIPVYTVTKRKLPTSVAEEFLVDIL